MNIDNETIAKMAHLARLEVNENEQEMKKNNNAQV